MNILRWIFSASLISAGIMIAGLLMSGTNLISQANAGNTDKPYHPSIIKIETIYNNAEFDFNRKSHLLRNARISYYLKQAKQADLRNWEFQRDDMVNRAKSILINHQQNYVHTSSEFASL